ncbi:hypothetical protein BGZ57DRAFT_848720 [Hyaloscypha finlandica]|nr:hypothetical protein BGZ57DRAFT_848720 [Hyaloscypha finlandica]KAH8801108.1 hypothetical protein F5882DRAFT_374100 [Hyaloscypha sp. PMI_1271]
MSGSEAAFLWRLFSANSASRHWHQAVCTEYLLQSILASGTEAHDGYSSRAKWVSVMQHAERLVSAAQSKGNQVCTVHTPLASSPKAVRKKGSIKEIARLGSSSHEIAATDPSQ